MLEAFIRLLIDNGLVQREAPADEDREVDEFARVSHHAVIAGRLGLDHGYEIDQHLTFGPYSSKLGDDYDDAAARARAGLEAGLPPPPLPAGFAADRFVRLVSGKNYAWLETAATMIDGSSWRRRAEGITKWAAGQEGCPEEYCRGVLRDMTSPEIGIVLDYGTRASRKGMDARAAEFGGELARAEARTAEELAARTPPEAAPA